MIFVTVGAQIPFDRLVRTVDDWAGRRGRGDVFAQIGESTYVPRHIEAVASLDPPAYAEKLRACEAIVGHAGMGTIISALEYGRPLLVMPRRGDLRETRNDHQIATAQRFGQRGMVHVAMDEDELATRLDSIDDLRVLASIEAGAARNLIDTIHRFIHS